VKAANRFLGGFKPLYIICAFIHNPRWLETCTTTKSKYEHHFWFRSSIAIKWLWNWWQWAVSEWETESGHYQNSLPKHNSVLSSLLFLLSLHGYTDYQNSRTRSNEKKIENIFHRKTLCYYMKEHQPPDKDNSEPSKRWSFQECVTHFPLKWYLKQGNLFFYGRSSYFS